MPKLPRTLLGKSKEELAAQVLKLEGELKTANSSLRRENKYGLFWANKNEEFDEKAKDALPVITPKANKKFPDVITDESAVNHVLIEGDNYHALSVLNYTHREKVDVIYIDPPYNTGNDGFKYRDKRLAKEFPDGVSVPKDHPFRHSYWLSFMAKRLKLAQELLKKTGVIFISIDDNEVAQLKLLCDEVFREENFLNIIIWKKTNSPKSQSSALGSQHEYVLLYAKNLLLTELNKSVGIVDEQYKKAFRHDDKDGRGVYQTVAIIAGGTQRSESRKSFEFHGVKEQWLYKKETLEQWWDDNRIYKTKNGQYRLKKYLSEIDGRLVSDTWIDDEIKPLQGGSSEYIGFTTQKPVSLIQRIVKVASQQNGIILDFFAGSGTTAHAVAQLNAEDGGKRKCILVTNNDEIVNGAKHKICEDVCYERMKRVLSGYKNAKGEKVEGLGGNLRYLKTDFVPKYTDEASRKRKRVSDKARLELTRRAGYMLAMKESTFDEKEMTKSWQILENMERITAVYFRENKKNLDKLVEKLSKMKKPVKLYIFSWYRGEYKSEYSEYENICCEDIPEPILEVYKNIGL